MKDPAFIQEMVTRSTAAGERVQNEFGSLSYEQLNWKPADNRWSIGQCLDHLIISDCLYFPTLKKIVAGNYRMKFWERWSPFTGMFGKMMVSQVGEKPNRKMKAPKILVPSASNIDTGILERFQKHLDTLIAFMIDCRNTELDRVHISSPVTGIITYSLRNAFLLLVQHEHRHISQGVKLKGMRGFPG